MFRKLLSLTAALFLILPLAACNVEQTEEGEAPEIQVEEGELPAYDVETGDVEVGTQTEEVEVPTVDYQTPEEEAAETEDEPPR